MATAPFQLTAAEVAQYHRDGYVIPSGFRLPQSMLDRIVQAHNALLEARPEFSDYCPHLLPLDLSFLNVAKEPGLVSAVTQLIGEDVALWNSSFFAKPAKTGRRVPFHQDGQYWCVRPLATCTVWIAIDRSHAGNGCLKVIPGSHKERRLYKHIKHTDTKKLALTQETDPSAFDKSTAVDLVLEPGQISLHDVYLIHGSEANTSGESRRGMTLRFMPTTSQYYRHLGPGFSTISRLPVFLISGVDRHGGNDFALMPKDLDLSGAPQSGSAAAAPDNTQGHLSFREANTIADGAIDVCQSKGFRPITVCVVDTAGHVVVLKRMDGCSPIAIPKFARAKALTCLAMKQSSRAIGNKYASPAKAAQLTSMVSITGGTFAAFPGGVPITSTGKIVGAVGVSGASADQDELCAVLGVHRSGLSSPVPPPSL